jgi:hypothetical protein
MPELDTQGEFIADLVRPYLELTGGGGVVTEEYNAIGGSAQLYATGLKDFVPTGVIPTNGVTFQLTGDDGAQGSIYVKQGVSVRTVTFTTPGRTILREVNTADDAPLSVAGSITAYGYHLFSAMGTAYCRLTKVFL